MVRGFVGDPAADDACTDDEQVEVGALEAVERPSATHARALESDFGWSSAILVRVAKTSLFTDIVGSTEKAVALGDAAWADLLERHHSVVRNQIRRFSGEEMDTSGDGFFVIFPDPASAIEAGRAIVEAVRPLGLTVRVGIHEGDCYVADGKCTGLAIHIGARIVALAEPGELLLSEAAMTEARSGYSFSDRGTHTLKGVPGSWRLFAVIPEHAS